MDAKSLAKSKRAHSLHHNKKHHPSKKKAGDREQNLPSNWDRFDADTDTEEFPATRTSETVAPKSKGADFAHLISEAKSQSEPISSASFAAEVLNGIDQGPSPLLFAEGQRLLSCISDYNFPFGEKETQSQEESFFSLSLQSLAEQLSKSSLVERLFIGPDVLPPDLLSEYQRHDATEIALDGGASNSISSETLVPDVNQTDSVAKRPSTFMAAAAELELDTLLDSFSEAKFFDSSSVTERLSHASSKTQASVLVKDWGKGHHMGSMSSSLDDSLDDLLKETSSQPMSTTAKGVLPVKDVEKEPDLRNLGSLEESLDDLLKETSNQTESTITNAPVQEVNVVTSGAKTSTPQPSSKSKIQDDFDSWFDSM